jgi:flagellar hook assembly protein FlgD
MTATPTATPTHLPFCFELIGNYPNPFDYGTNIVFKICSQADVTLKIYTISGENVETMTESKSAGKNNFYWDCRNNHRINSASGVFIYSIEAVSGVDRKKQWGKMALVR